MNIFKGVKIRYLGRFKNDKMEHLFSPFTVYIYNMFKKSDVGTAFFRLEVDADLLDFLSPSEKGEFLRQEFKVAAEVLTEEVARHIAVS